MKSRRRGSGIFKISCIMLLVSVLVLLAGCQKKMTIQDYLDLGEKYLTESDYQQAIVAFNKVIELDPKQVIAYEKLADSYIGLDKKEEAVDILCRGVNVITKEEAGPEGQALKERAVTLCEELLQTYLVTNTDEAKRYYEQLKQLDEAKAAQYENELQQAFAKEKIKSNYEDSLKNARAQIAGDAWETLSVDQFSWKFELSKELDDKELEDIVYDYGDGTYLQVTKRGYVYYGNMKDGKREGDNGIWFCLSSNGYKYCFNGMWKDGYPNGSGEVWDIDPDVIMMITTGTWSSGLEDGKMQMKSFDSTNNDSRIFVYSVSHGMPEIIDYNPVDNGDIHCVLAYAAGETETPDSYGYENESGFPLGIYGLGLELGDGKFYVNTHHHHQ